MDFLNKAYGQLTDLFRSMTPAARITAALLVCAIVISLMYLFRTNTSSADELLLGGREFSSAEIAAAEALTGRHGRPEEIAQAIFFLLSSRASWVNGVDLKVDGGFHALRTLAGRG